MARMNVGAVRARLILRRNLIAVLDAVVNKHIGHCLNS